MAEQEQQADLGALSAVETAMILKHREEQARIAANKAFRHKVLKTALAFYEWCEAEGCGPTFSTFVNEFEYQEDDASLVYKAIMGIFNKLCELSA